MGKEVHRHAGTHAFLVANEEDFLQIRQALGTHRENDFVHHVIAQDIGEVTHGPDAVQRLERDFARGIEFLAEEAAQPHVVLVRSFQRPRQFQSPFAGAGDQHLVRRYEFAPQNAHHAARGQPKKQQQNPRVGGKQQQEWAAQFEAEGVLENYQAKRRVCHLPESVAQDDAGVRGIELFINFEPPGNRY